MTTEEMAGFENALVAQKNAILDDVNTGTIEALDRAKANLSFVAPMWRAVGYGYKTAELRMRIEGAAGDQMRLYAAKLQETGGYMRKVVREAIEALNEIATKW